MSAGQAVRSSLRSGRVRLALGVTTAAVALAVGGSLNTAHADTARPTSHHKADTIDVGLCDDTPDPNPVEAVPGGVDKDPKPVPQQTFSYVLDCSVPVPDGGDPVDAVPVPDGDDPVDAVPGGYDSTPAHHVRDARIAPVKR
ncbi:hypothetical protein R6V09_30780 [Streptomyces sp. W16]|uniref:hypothetical protein n=1 Tax=Streptomyces sp. W16 TaxID=3076631 RepID=UPI00295A9DB8|nr:hypothetical protein [Streptomyces sp. W16]MDV9174480.1 hypothetical protein [Streptomyces sp. W16]